MTTENTSKAAPAEKPKSQPKPAPVSPVFDEAAAVAVTPYRGPTGRTVAYHQPAGDSVALFTAGRKLIRDAAQKPALMSTSEAEQAIAKADAAAKARAEAEAAAELSAWEARHKRALANKDDAQVARCERHLAAAK